MATQTISKSVKEWKRLEGKAKQGWRAYYVVCDELFDIGESLRISRKQNIELIKQIKEGNDNIDLEFLKKQFVELYELANKNCECPVCFEILNKETIYVSSCGHLTCKSCYGSMDKCPICRKAYWKKDEEETGGV
jgi:hypothetical protein